MDDSVASSLAGFGLVVMLVVFLLTILWILVPFAIFGIKPLLRRLSGQLAAIEKQNTEVITALRELRQNPVAPRDDRPVPPQLAR